MLLVALIKQKQKYTQVENFGLLATPFGQASRALALSVLTCALFVSERCGVRNERICKPRER